MPLNVPRRRRSSDVAPGDMLASITAPRQGSLAGPSQEADNHNRMEPLPGAFDRNHTPADPSALAAWIFANASRHEGEAQDPSRMAENAGSGGESLPVSPADPRPGSSRQGAPFHHHRRPHANTNSSTRTSGPSQRNSCTRTQSISTYSNNMTPISPATNATSFLTVDSAEDDDDDKKSAGSLSRSERDPGSSTRPSTSDPSAEPDGKGSGSDPSQLSPPVGGNKSPYSRSMTGNRPSPSPPPSATTPRSDPGIGYSPTSPYDPHHHSHHHHRHHNHHQQQPPQPPPQPPPQGDDGEGSPRRLPKKRSRLRLAFWRRKNHHSHQQEVGGEM